MHHSQSTVFSVQSLHEDDWPSQPSWGKADILVWSRLPCCSLSFEQTPAYCRILDGCCRAEEGWFNQGYIFPEGFKSQVNFRSSVVLDQLCIHECSVLGREGQFWPAPTFKVVAMDHPDKPLYAKSCTGCWSGVSILTDRPITLWWLMNRFTLQTDLLCPIFGRLSLEMWDNACSSACALVQKLSPWSTALLDTCTALQMSQAHNAPHDVSELQTRLSMRRS